MELVIHDPVNLTGKSEAERVIKIMGNGRMAWRPWADIVTVAVLRMRYRRWRIVRASDGLWVLTRYPVTRRCFTGSLRDNLRVADQAFRAGGY